jgi:DNA-binding MarR family transcriptional regulator
LETFPCGRVAVPQLTRNTLVFMTSHWNLSGGTPDPVDAILTQWRAALPDVDTSHLAVVARIRRAAHRLQAHTDRLLQDDGLNRGEFDVLCTLRRAGGERGLTPSELAGSMLVSTGGVTKRLDALEQAGWITRRQSARDRRSVLVKLTAAGRRRLDRLLPAHFAAEATALGALGPGQRAELAGLLDALLNGMDAAVTHGRAAEPALH